MRTGQIIAKLRSEAGMSQQQLADVLFVSRDLISKWETGRRLPDYRYIEIMADLFSVDPEELVTRESILMTEFSALIPDRYPEDAESLKNDINAFLSGLSERDASVFIRRYYFLEDPAEIGEKYGIKQNYVRTMLMRTRRKFRAFLERKVRNG